MDVIITKNYYTAPDDYLILLGQKHAEVNTNKWRLIGGFIDKKDNGRKNAAIREVREETNLDISREIITFVNQYTVDDWRYRGSKDGIMTTVFHVDLNKSWDDKTISSLESPSDDIAKLQWFKKSDVLKNLNKVHYNILNDFIK